VHERGVRFARGDLSAGMRSNPNGTKGSSKKGKEKGSRFSYYGGVLIFQSEHIREREV